MIVQHRTTIVPHNIMKALHNLLDEKLKKNPNLTLNTSELMLICIQFNLTGQQLKEAIQKYCRRKDINLEEYDEHIGQKIY